MWICLLAASFSALVGIDLGYANVKFAVVIANRSLRVGRTHDGQKLVPTMFAFWNQTRPSNTAELHNWTESSAAAFDWAWGQPAHERYLQRPATAVPARRLTRAPYFGLAGYELLSLWLHSLVDSIRRADNVSEPIEVVFAIPPSLTSQEKSYLYAAASLAGIRVTQFIDYFRAPAEMYALKPEAAFHRAVQNVAFADIGAHGIRVSIWEFDGRENITKMRQLGGQSVEGMGGQSLDIALGNYLATKHNFNISTHKAAVNFIADCQMIRKSFSVYSGVEYTFENDEDEDNKTVAIDRLELLNLTKEFNETFICLAQKALKQSGLTRVDGVETIGQIASCPYVRELIQSAFNVSELNTTLQPDHAHAFGAAIVAARNSNSYQVHEINRVGLHSSSAWLIIDNKTYGLFEEGKADDVAVSTRSKVRPNQKFVIASDQPQNGFMKFFLANITKETEVEFVFVHNDYLMPIPLNASTMDGKEIEIVTENLEWEVTRQELTQSQTKVSMLLELQKERREREMIVNVFEELLLDLQRFCNTATALEPGDKEFLLSIVQSNMEWYEDRRAIASIDEFNERIGIVHNETENLIKIATERQRKQTNLLELRKSIAKAEQRIAKAMALGINAKEPQAEHHVVDQWLKENESTANASEFEAKRQQLDNSIASLDRTINAVEQVPDPEPIALDQL
jgi:molecular chaperone DnaK (HSP70)